MHSMGLPYPSPFDGRNSLSDTRFIQSQLSRLCDDFRIRPDRYAGPCHTILFDRSIRPQVSGDAGGKCGMRRPFQHSQRHLFAHLSADRTRIMQSLRTDAQPGGLGFQLIHDGRTGEPLRDPRNLPQSGSNQSRRAAFCEYNAMARPLQLSLQHRCGVIF